ncbi:MAG: deoxynucleoside kinase, partial [Candidatus Methylomirabilales bacterium]
RVRKPDLVIYLQADVETLLRRIGQRGKLYEGQVDRQYLEDVVAAYNHFFFHYSETPLLVVNTSEMDFVKRKEDLDDLIRQLHEMKAGTQYYVPLGS